MTAPAKTLEVGRILGPHGLRGEVKVRPHWAGSESLLEARTVVVQRDGGAERRLEIAEIRRGPHGLLVRFSGVGERGAAAELAGATIAVERADLPPLADGEFYLVDLIGAEVVAPDGPVGRVLEIRSHPSVDCLVIRLLDGREAEQPLGEAWIARVDLAERRIELESTDGLVV